MSTVIVYGVVRGGPGTSGQALAYNGSFWVPAAALPTGSPGTAQSAWNDGDTIQIAVPAPSSPGAGGGGSTSTLGPFVMPAVWTFASPVVLSVAFQSTAQMSAGAGLTIPNYGSFIVETVTDSTHATILNTGASGNVVAGTTIPNGSAVNIAGSGAPLAAAARANGQALQLVAGQDTPVGIRHYCNVLSFAGVDPTGASDSYAGIVLAVAFAIANSLTLYIPFGTYQLSRHVFMPGSLTIVGDDLKPTLNSGFFGQFWGGGFVGDCFVNVPLTIGTPMEYAHTGNFYRAKIGGTAASANFPLMFLTETPFGSLNGMTTLTLEYLINVSGGITSNTWFPYCGGRKSDHSALTEAIKVGFSTAAGASPFDMSVAIHVAGGSGTVSLTTAGTPFAKSTDYFVRITWNGTTLKLEAGAPGGAPSITVSNTGGTGAIVQKPWEDFIVGGSANGPSRWPLANQDFGPPMQWGCFRKSKSIRTGNLPSTEFVAADVDTNADLVISFDPAYRSGLTGIIGACGHPVDFNVILGAPCNSYIPWRNIFQTVTENAPVCVFKSLTFGSYGAAISAECAQNLDTFDCKFITRKGVLRHNNSYYGRDVRPNFTTEPYNAGNASHTWGLARTLTSGLGEIEQPIFSDPVQGTAAIVGNGAGGTTVRDLKINTVNGAIGLFWSNDSQGSIFINCGMGTEAGGGGLDTLAIFNLCSDIEWRGGGLYVAAGTAASGANVLIDGGCHYRFNFDPAAVPGGVTAHFTCPSAPVYPIEIGSTYQGQGLQNALPWSDGTAPVVLTELETNGRSVWDATGSGSITCQWFTSANGAGTPIAEGASGGPTGPDFSCRTIVITDSGSHLTGTTLLIAPTFFAGYRRRIVAPSHAITFGAATGATVTIAAGKSAEVESNGSGWERVTADV